MQSDLSESAAASAANALASTPSSQSSRKRKSASSASRGVASLTPEQLAKKRANDRDAQRAIRERTKQTIESLERRIRELESQQPYQELQVVVREKEAIQAENDDIRRRLTSVLALIQPVVGTTQRLNDLAHHNVQAGLAQPGNAFQQEPSFLSDPSRQYTDPSSLPQGQPGPYMFPADVSSASDSRGWQAPRESLDQQRNNNIDSADRGSFNFLFTSLSHRDGSQAATQQGLGQPLAARPTYPAIGSQPYGPSEPIWQQLPKHVEPTCTVDSIWLDFYHAKRAALSANPAALDQIPTQPSLSYLLNPTAASNSQQSIDPISELTTNIMSKFPNLSALPEQAACLLFVFHLVRWQLNPTEENYLRLPEWLQPTETQLDTPHPAWLDFVHWPSMRDKMITSYQDFPFDNWSISYIVTLSVNWPYEPSDCFLKIPLGGGGGGGGIGVNDNDDFILNPVFERHVRKLENWSISPNILDVFPSLEGTCTIRPPAAKEQDTVPSSTTTTNAAAAAAAAAAVAAVAAAVPAATTTATTTTATTTSALLPVGVRPGARAGEPVPVARR